jgi:hypothetical protein
MTQKAKKDSQTFELTIYKDKEMTKKIAVLADGNLLSANQVNPGNLTDVTIKPADWRVQRNTTITVTFTISHNLTSNARVMIRLPSGLLTPKAGSFVAIRSPNKSTTATKGLVLPGNMVRIDRFLEEG